jgi:N-sulfoglucosamine sulfohydrolase
MKKIFFLFLLGISSVFAQKMPNIIWLSAEDLSPRLGCYGDYTVPTPNIDKIAKHGVMYTNVFTTAGVCAPSRNAIATGRIQTSNGGHNMRTQGSTYPEKTGLPKHYSVVMPPDVKHFAELLRAQGYYCTNNVKTDYQFEDIPSIWDESSTTAHYKNRKEGQPFFAIFNSTITHESQVWARSKHPLRVDPKKVKLPPFYPDTDSVRLDVARFYSNISELDDWVGEKMKELEENGLLENTIVMFWGDHGDGLPFYKREVYDRGLRVPFLVRFPSSYPTKGQKPANSTDDRMISAIDWPATVLSLAGIPTPKWMQGKAFLGKYATTEGHPYIFGARDRLDSEYDRVRSVSDGSFQYIRNFSPEKPLYMDIEFRKQQASMREILRMRDNGLLNETQMIWFKQTKPLEEFYDIKADPFQLVNLIDNSKYASKISTFRKVFTDWQKEVYDYGEIEEKSLVKQMWNGQSVPPTTANPILKIEKSKLMISSATEGVSIVYKIIKNGIEPQSWEVYSKPITIPKNAKVKAMAQRIGFQPSEIIVL